MTALGATYIRGGSLTLRSCCCARQRCSFVAGICVSGTTITAGSDVAPTGPVGVAATATVTVGIGEAVANGGASNPAVACPGGAALGTLLAVLPGNVVLLGKRVGRTCTWVGVPICIGCPQPANTSTINSIYQRRTLANTILRTSVLVHSTTRQQLCQALKPGIHSGHNICQAHMPIIFTHNTLHRI